MSDDFNNLPPWLRGNEPDDKPDDGADSALPSGFESEWDAPPPPTPEELAAKEAEKAEDMLGDAFASVFDDGPQDALTDDVLIDDDDDPLAGLGDDDAADDMPWMQSQPQEDEAEPQDALEGWRIESDVSDDVFNDSDVVIDDDSVWGAPAEAVIEGGADIFDSDEVSDVGDDEDAWDGGAAAEAAFEEEVDPYSDFAPVDIPPWLRGAEEELPGQQASLTTDDGVLSDAWLAQGDTLSDSYEAELTYDQWMAQQDAATRERTLEEEVPDFIAGGLDDSGLPGTSPFAAGG
ncbi:MAG: hypothetical protein H7175_23530, partial [Burkholderiales bacterium]|nr:hypothetical protein [Anaerolineae bacterium]